MLEKILESNITTAVSTLDLDNVFTDTYDVFLIKGYNNKRIHQMVSLFL